MPQGACICTTIAVRRTTLFGSASPDDKFEALNSQAGELVRVRSVKEITKTLTAQRRYRGTWLDREIMPYCGKVSLFWCRMETFTDKPNGNRQVGQAKDTLGHPRRCFLGRPQHLQLDVPARGIFVLERMLARARVPASLPDGEAGGRKGTVRVVGRRLPRRSTRASTPESPVRCTWPTRDSLGHLAKRRGRRASRC
jgi:hypothetical protein